MYAAYLGQWEPVRKQFTTNWQGYWQAYHWMFTIALIAASLDVATTIYFMHLEGPAEEVHPVIRNISLLIGPTIGPMIGKSLQLASLMLVTIYLRSLAGYIYFTTIAMYTWASWYNLWGRDLYTPFFMPLFV
ncbi:MAG: hypothetical protein ACF8OB_04040 [Phycisphaeraceae bacterium JB051]